jgi:hypothetical protein
METLQLNILKTKENIMKKFWQFVFGRDRFLELPLKKRLLISYLGDYNCGKLNLGRRIFNV